MTIVGRNAERLASAAETVGAATQYPVASYRADFTNLDSVRDLAEKLREAHEEIDLLVNNADAGQVTRKQTRSADGYEQTLALNHRADFLLTNLVLDPLLTAPGWRVVVVSSDTSLKATLDLDDLNFEHRKWNMWAAYRQSKLADVLFAAELARRFDLNGLTAHSLHPGIVLRTNLANSSGLLGLAWKARKPFLASSQNGARTPLYLCTEPGIENLTGQYFTKGNVPAAHPDSTTSTSPRSSGIAPSRWSGYRHTDRRRRQSP